MQICLWLNKLDKKFGKGDDSFVSTVTKAQDVVYRGSACVV